MALRRLWLGMSMRGMAFSRASVYGIRVCSNTDSVLPCSTICPPYMTATSSVRPATTARLWLMRIKLMLPFGLEILEQLKDLGLHGHVESRGRLVGDEELGPAGQGDGDGHPLAHPAGQLMGKLHQPPARLRHPHHLEQLARRGHRRVAAHLLVAADGLGDLVADLHDRVQRRERILEHDGDAGSPELALFPLGHGPIRSPALRRCTDPPQA